MIVNISQRIRYHRFGGWWEAVTVLVRDITRFLAGDVFPVDPQNGGQLLLIARPKMVLRPILSANGRWGKHQTWWATSLASFFSEQNIRPMNWQVFHGKRRADLIRRFHVECGDTNSFSLQLHMKLTGYIRVQNPIGKKSLDLFKLRWRTQKK